MPNDATMLKAAPEARFLESPLHEVFRKFDAHVARSSQSTVNIPLHVGEPGYGPPACVIAAVARAFHDGGAGYCDAAGLASLRGVLADKLRGENQIATDAERVLITPGSTQALYATFTLLAAPGDEVVLPVPHWPIYAQQCAALSLRPRHYAVSSAGEVDFDALKAMLSPRTRFLLVNSPSNPAGSVLTVEALQRILELTARYKTPVISDEAYEDFAYARAHVSLASLERPEHGQRRVFTTFTFSKTFALTGLRVGYVVAPDLTSAFALRRVQEASLVCPSTPAQRGAAAAMEVRSEAVALARAHLARAFDVATPLLQRSGLLKHAPQGGWYAMCTAPASYATGEAFADELLARHGVGVAPGRSFAPAPLHADTGMERTFRVALCGTPEHVREGVERLCASLNDRR